MNLPLSQSTQGRRLQILTPAFLSPLPIFGLVMFLTAFGDAIMSYTSPIFIEDKLGGSFVMGLVIAFSSVVGIAMDLLIPKLFGQKPYTFFFWATILAAFCFPVAYLLLPPVMGTLLLGMGFWGIYYELIQFTNFHFIGSFIPRSGYPAAWGGLSAFKGAAYMAGPLLASYLLNASYSSAFLGALFFFTASSVGFLLFSKHFRSHHLPVVDHPKPQSFLHVFRTWKTLWPKIWPVYIFLAALSLVDSTFWTVGALLSEELHQTSGMVGNLLLPAYTLPALFMGIFTAAAAKPMGKKRAAFLSGTLSGLILSLGGLTSNPLLLLGLVFFSSLLNSISVPEIAAVFEDYVQRLGPMGDDLIGLQSSATSLSYIIGPILAGTLAAVLGNQVTFTAMGILLASVSAFALIIVPRKIRMPQKELSNL